MVIIPIVKTGIKVLPLKQNIASYMLLAWRQNYNYLNKKSSCVRRLPGMVLPFTILPESPNILKDGVTK